MNRKKVILLFPCVLALVLLTGWLQLARLDAAVIVPPTATSANFNLTYLNQIGGSAYAVTIEGNRAYVGTGPRLQIFDIQAPSNPVLLGQTTAMNGRVASVQVAGNYAYALSSSNQDPANQGPNELYVFDISDPANPIWWGTAPLAGRPNEMTLVGNYVFIASSSVWNGTSSEAGGLYILDITNPGVPMAVGYYDTDGYAYDVAVQGNYAYVGALVTTSSELLVINISNPASPSLTHSTNLPHTAQGLHLSGSYLYLALGNQNIEAYSLANPAAPVRVGGIGTPSLVYDLVVEGNYAYVANFTSGLRIIDVTNPASMVIVGNYNAPGSNFTYKVDVSGNYVYIGYMTYGFAVVDVSTPSAPQEVGHANEIGYVAGVAAAGNLLYTLESSDSDGLFIYDATNPFTLTPLGAYTGTYASDIVISGTYAYLGGSGLRIVDISNPNQPVLVGYLNSGTVRNVELVGSYAYISRSDNILIADISNPTAPVALGSLNTTAYPDEMDITGTHAFVANTYGMAVVDVSQPLTPTLVTTYNPFVGEVSAIALKGNYAYLAVEIEGIHVLDISNPANPIPVGLSPLPAAPHDQAYFKDDYLYVSSSGYGLYIFDVSNPVSPTLTAAYNTAGTVWGTAATGSRLYAADGYGGLYIFSTSSLPALSVNNEAAPEGNGGFPSLVFEVQLSIPSTRTVTVSYATVDGTAQAGSDYIAASGTVTIQPGNTIAHIPISLVPDTILEPDETFSLVISNPVNAVIVDNTGVGTLLNDDLPEMFISDSTVVEGNSGTRTATFTVTLSGPGTFNAVASFRTFDGTAQAGSDYAAAEGQIILPPGQTTQVISITIYGDVAVEPDETFTVELGKENNVILADYVGLGTILNDDFEGTDSTIFLPLMLKP